MIIKSIWIKKNLEKYTINFTDFDNTKSNDPKYSSISDYKQFKFEDLILNANWKNFNLTKISRKKFIKIDDKYKGKNLTDLSESDIKDIDKKEKIRILPIYENG